VLSRKEGVAVGDGGEILDVGDGRGTLEEAVDPAAAVVPRRAQRLSSESDSEMGMWTESTVKSEASERPGDGGLGRIEMAGDVSMIRMPSDRGTEPKNGSDGIAGSRSDVGSFLVESRANSSGGNAALCRHAIKAISMQMIKSCKPLATSSCV